MGFALNFQYFLQLYILMRIRDRTTVYLYSISVCMGSFVLGYELTSYGNLSHLFSQIKQFESKEQYMSTKILLSGILALSAIFGVSFYKCIVDSFGYLNSFRYLDYVTIVGCIIGATGMNLQAQLLSRIILGFAVGLNTIIIPVYLTSCLPGSMGGPAGTLNQLFITIGIMFGYLMGFLVLQSEVHGVQWRLLILLPILPCLVRLHTVKNVFPYETVQYMIKQQNDEMLQKYIDHIWEDVTLQEFKQSKKMSEEDIASQEVPYGNQIGQPYRRRFNMASLIIFFNQFSGSSTSFAFATFVFPMAVGIEQSDILQAFVYLTLLQVIVTFVAGQFLQKYGRRSFMLEGQRVIIITLVLLGFIQMAGPQFKYIEYILIFVHIIGFSLSFGPCSFLIGTEIMHDITYPSIFFWIFIFISGLINAPMLLYYGPSRVFFFLAFVSVLGLLYVGFYLVETQGKSRQQVYKQFRNMCFPLPLKWRKFLTKRNTAQDDKKQIQKELISQQRI